MPIKRDIIYTRFLECSNYATDQFWENIFEELAYGKCPYGTYISKDFLCCNFKNKDFNYKIEKNKDALVIYNEVYNLLTTKLGLLSQNDKQKKRKAFKDFEDNIKDSRKCWNDIRKKNIKELLIEIYVTDMKVKYNLSIQDSRYLLSLIYMAMLFKVISSNDIIYENDRIVNVKGISFHDKKIIIERELYQIENNISPTIILDKKLLSDNWEKYIKDLYKISLTI